MASVFDPLIALASKPIRQDDAMWMISQLDTGSDTSIVLLGGAFIENVLRDAVAANLVESESGHKVLFRRNGPFSNFDSLILIAYAIGVIDKETRHDLTAIRHIRNAFAHAPRELSIGMVEITAVCDSMHVARGALGESSTTPQKRLSYCIKALILLLMSKAFLAKYKPDAAGPLPGK